MMMKMKINFYIVFIGLVFSSIYFSSCKKDKLLTTGGSLSFSTDTLKFDTVFTTLGSATRQIKLYNLENSPIKISNIKIQNGLASPFRLNADGIDGKSIDDILIAPNDSIYIFVAVTVNPNMDSLPFIVEDKIIVTLNENEYDIDLQAYGQNAHYINGEYIGTETWQNDKPYVIINSAAVDTNETLTIQKGCRIYMNQNSKLIVFGKLLVFGTKEDSVIFQGDRLDRDYFNYKDYPGEWQGVYFANTSSGSVLNYTVLKNGGGQEATIYLDESSNRLLTMNNCELYNSLNYGIFAINSNFQANNCLIHTCGQQNVAMVKGGNYEMNFCTLATFGGIGFNHTKYNVLAALNYLKISETQYEYGNLETRFNNCIIYGPNDNETFFGKDGNATFFAETKNCIIKQKDGLSADVIQINTILNQDPLFEEIGKWDFHIRATSPAKNNGVFIAAFPIDLENKTRHASQPTIGCYE